jgi:hypothetical protein
MNLDSLLSRSGTLEERIELSESGSQFFDSVLFAY